MRLFRLWVVLCVMTNWLSLNRYIQHAVWTIRERPHARFSARWIERIWYWLAFVSSRGGEVYPPKL